MHTFEFDDVMIYFTFKQIIGLTFAGDIESAGAQLRTIPDEARREGGCARAVCHLLLDPAVAVGFKV